ncbi:MAG: hypothetical protein IT562_20875 [Alphaproteobacteria bacterium]|nr:hypothetical protein [Alphaproteobacteria bacterium]
MELLDEAEMLGEAFWEANDAIHILPMNYIPLKTRALRGARLVKNSALESMVEVFADNSAGSGQVPPRDLPRLFTIDDEQDLRIVDSLALLSSYDVYSLRIELRRLKIDVEASKYLRLSSTKQAALAPQMTRYVRPLIAHVYGTEQKGIQTFADIARLFRDPDVGTALANLRMLARKLKVELEEVPLLLAEYGDAFLSLSYFENCLEEVTPQIQSMLATIQAIRDNPQHRDAMALQRSCNTVHHHLSLLMTEAKGLNDMFHMRTEGMWEKISAESFRELQSTIQGFQTAIGQNLCVAVVKAKDWSRHFPSEAVGNLTARARVILSEIRPAIDRIAHLNYADVGGRLAILPDRRATAL